MTGPICFSCHEELRYISHRRMMCYNTTCEKIYGMDYACASCSAKKHLKVLMEVVAPEKVRCPLCMDERDAPGLNLETMMRDKTIARMGGRGQRPVESIPSGGSVPRNTSTGSRRATGIGTRRARQPYSTEDSIFSPTKSRTARKEGSVSSHHTFLIFPERAEPYIEEVSDGLTIIIEFPGHTIEQIQLRKVGTILIIESSIVSCSYRDEITLPNWATSIEPEVKLSKGFLTIRFARAPDKSDLSVRGSAK